jgi:hypothetical protein
MADLKPAPPSNTVRLADSSAGKILRHGGAGFILAINPTAVATVARAQIRSLFAGEKYSLTTVFFLPLPVRLSSIQLANPSLA